MDTVLLKQKVFAEIKKRRQAAEMVASLKLDDLYNRADFDKAYTRERAAELDFAKLDAKGADTTLQKKEVYAARAATDAVLRKYGKTRESLNPQYTCKLCNDRGIKDGKYCVCAKKLIAKYADCGTEVNPSNTFCSDSEDNEQNKRAINIAKEWCESYPAVDKNNIVVYGHTGVGKTFLCDCIANELLTKDVNVVSITAYRLNDLFVKDMTSFGKDDVISSLLNADVLVVDDLGKEPVYRTVTLENLYVLLNERQIRGLSTIINTNLSFKDVLDRYGESIFARLFNKRNTNVIRLIGEDKRLK